MDETVVFDSDVSNALRFISGCQSSGNSSQYSQVSFSITKIGGKMYRAYRPHIMQTKYNHLNSHMHHPKIANV